jgi:transposase
MSTALGLSARTIERMKKRFVEDGLDAAIERKTMDTSSRDIKFDGEFAAKITALACSEAPEGRSRWTVRLLAEKAVELKIVDSVSAMTIQRVLKKTNLNLTRRNAGKSRPLKTGLS